MDFIRTQKLRFSLVDVHRRGGLDKLPYVFTMRKNVNESLHHWPSRYLLSDDSYPIVLGFEDILTDVALYSDYPQQEVFLSFR